MFIDPMYMQCRYCSSARDNGTRYTCHCIAHDGEMSIYASCDLFSDNVRRNGNVSIGEYKRPGR